MTRSLLAFALALGLFPAAANAADPKPKDIDLVLCLDVSNSMDGLIDSAKIKLWDVVNELAKVKPTPNLRVALYSYGHSSYPQANGWVRKDLDLTTDLDEVYSKLTALTTNGGEEYVARVTQTALKDLKWSADEKALKVIFVCGNEPATQDRQVKLDDVAELARKNRVVINAIYCGPNSNAESAGWRSYATMANGAYANIDQDRAKKDLIANIKTPFDGDLLKLSAKLNTTYVAFGKKGAENLNRQAAQDRGAASAAPAAALGRAESKANALYRNGEWDMVDRLKEDPKFDITKVPEDELCDELKKMKPAERVEYVKKKAEERAKIQKEINDLSAKRAKAIEEERKKLPKTDGEKALDEAVKGIIRDQAKEKGFEVPTSGAK